MKSRNSSIDLLRFLAASLVAFSHMIIFYQGINLNIEIISSISVEIFFIISGFVLAPQIINLVKKNNFYNYKIFLIRRWYRTIPIFILSLILTSILLDKLFTFDFLKYAFFIQNFLYISVNQDYFSIAWSLSVEEWFYIIFPLFLIISSRINNKKNILILSLIFILLILILRIMLINDQEWGNGVRRIVLFRLDAIAFGFLLFHLIDKININKIINIILIATLIFTIFLFHIMKINATQGVNFYEIFFHYVVAIWGSLIVIIFYFLEGLIKNLKIIELNLFLGKISYSIYLFHLPIIYLISIFEWPLVLAILIYIFLQFSFSSLIYIYFEEPILKSRPNYR